MKVDTHLHTSHSGNTTLSPLKYLLRESYHSPEGVVATLPLLFDLVARPAGRTEPR